MLTWHDQFCGAGGSAQGFTRVPGTQLKLAANHWRRAVETHAANFPDADHDIADISSIAPSRWPKADLLWASPECTNHTSAKNHQQAREALTLFDPDKEAERSRVTMFDVPRFAEHHKYQGIIVENVIEARSWVGFKPWLEYMHNLGYDHQIVYWNSAFQPYGRHLESQMAPQSRDRMYTVFWRKGNKAPRLNFKPAAWCAHCEKTVPGRQRWKSDFDEKLAAATARATKTKAAGVPPDRIRWGLYKQQYTYTCPTCSNEVYPWMPAALNAIDFSLPAMRIGDRDTPLAANTLKRIRRGLEKYRERPGTVVNPVGMLVPMDRLNDPGGKIPRGLDEPMATQTARANDMLTYGHPVLMQVAGHTFEHPGSTCRTREVTEPMKTQTATHDTSLVVMPFVATMRGGGSKEKVAGIDSPIGTVSAKGNHHLLVAGPNPVALIVRNNGDGNDSGWASTPVDEPLRTIATKGAQSLLTNKAFIDTYNGTANPRDVAEPLTSVLATDTHGLVQTPHAYLVPSGGTWAERAVPVQEPAPTFTTRESYGVAEITDEDVDDCTYRMLAPKEIGAGMAFDPDYIVLGSKREQVAQYGNAVTPNAAELIARALVESLT